MKILVTGGAGFLGSHLSRKLLDDGHEVICLDNFYTGSRKNIAQFEDLKNFKLLELDVTNSINIEIDGIFNLACPASPIHYQRNPVETLKANVHGAINVLDLAMKVGARILQASTSEIYGDPKISPQPESYWGNVNPIGIRSCYDEGKRAAETLFFDYHREYGVDIRVARIFNTYGPNMAMDDGRVVSNFIVQALLDKPLTVYGDGNQVRSLCYVEDLIDGLHKLFFTENIHEPINIGNPQPITMLELAEEVIKLTNSNSIIQYLELPSDDPLTREPVITKAQELLSWNPKVERQLGLKRTIDFFAKELNLK